MHKSVLNSTLGHKNGLSKYVCCLCVTNFLFFWCKALCTNFFMCKSYAHKALCVNLVLYAKLKDKWAEASDEPNSTTQGFLFNPHI